MLQGRRSRAASMNWLGCWPARGLPRRGRGGGQWSLGRGSHFPGPSHPGAPEAKKTRESPWCEGQRLSTLCKSSNRCQDSGRKPGGAGARDKAPQTLLQTVSSLLPGQLVYLQPPVADSWGVARILGMTLLVQPGPFFPSVVQEVLPPSSPPSLPQVHTLLCLEKVQHVPDHELTGLEGARASGTGALRQKQSRSQSLDRASFSRKNLAFLCGPAWS